MRKINVPRASSEQSREVIDEVLDDLQALVDEFNQTLPFANEWAAINALHSDLTDIVARVEASLGVWEVTRKGVRVTTIEVPAALKTPRSLRDQRCQGSRQKTKPCWLTGAVDPSSSTSTKRMMMKNGSNNGPLTRSCKGRLFCYGLEDQSKSLSCATI
jgi:hypothetical protein